MCIKYAAIVRAGSFIFTMTFTRFVQGNYICTPVADARVQARDFFDSLPGSLLARTIDLCFCDAMEIVGLKERSEYTPAIRLFE